MERRRIPAALIAVLAAQTLGGLVWAGGAAARISALEERVGEQRLVAERLARLEEQGVATKAALERIERMVEGKGRGQAFLPPLHGEGRSRSDPGGEVS